MKYKFGVEDAVKGWDFTLLAQSDLLLIGKRHISAARRISMINVTTMIMVKSINFGGNNPRLVMEKYGPDLYIPFSESNSLYFKVCHNFEYLVDCGALTGNLD